MNYEEMRQAVQERYDESPKPNILKPSRLQTSVNAAGAAGRVIKAIVKFEKIKVSSEECDHRLAICQACEFFDGHKCLKCGCVMKWKTKFATEHCPIAKW